MRLWKFLIVLALVLGLLPVIAQADYYIPVPAGTRAIVFSFVCQQIKLCSATTLIDSTGAEKATYPNPLITNEPVKQYVGLGYVQYTNLITATALNPPAGATLAEVCVEIQGIRYRDDGTSPTTNVGMPVVPLSPTQPNCFPYAGNIPSVQIIQLAVGSVVNVTYYRGIPQ